MTNTDVLVKYAVAFTVPVDTPRRDAVRVAVPRRAPQ